MIELKGAVQVSAASHVLSVDGLGRAQSWGLGAKAGERDHLAPGREPRMDKLVALAAGTNHSLGVTASGDVVAWGQNAFQQLGVFRKRTSPTWVQVNDPANAVNTQNAVPVVEFVNPSIGFGHYFVTAFGAEQKDLDTGANVKGWQRTGRTWRAWLDKASAPSNAKPVYRFFSSKFNTHFYTADEAEKNSLVAGTDWKLEATSFYAAPSGTTCPSLRVSPMSPFLCKDGPPTTQDCPSGYYPVYRAYDIAEGNRRTDPNHRFTPNWIDVYRNVRFHGHVYEGVAFCSPASAQLGGDLQAFHTYPGDSANAGDFLSGEYWYGNAGPGKADGATIVAAMPDNWTVTSCTEYDGASAPIPQPDAEGIARGRRRREPAAGRRAEARRQRRGARAAGSAAVRKLDRRAEPRAGSLREQQCGAGGADDREVGRGLHGDAHAVDDRLATRGLHRVRGRERAGRMQLVRERRGFCRGDPAHGHGQRHGQGDRGREQLGR